MTFRRAHLTALHIQLAADRRNARCDPYTIPARNRIRAITREIARRQGERA